MSESILSSKRFQDEQAAYDFIESQLWPEGPVCPHCGEKTRIGQLKGKTTRRGLYKCYACRKPFTVTMGNIFEDSHVPMHQWLQAIYLMCSSKKGISSNQLHRTLGVTLKTAWFMTHRIRHAMNQEPNGPFGGIVEGDETFIGGKLRVGPLKNKPGERPKDRLSHTANKAPVFSLVQRGGNVKSYHVDKVTARNLRPIVDKIVAKDAHLMTDTSTVLDAVGFDRKHSKVNHNEKEYVRMENGECITTNTVEGYFSILKRGINGVYHHCEAKRNALKGVFDYPYDDSVAVMTPVLLRPVDRAQEGAIGEGFLA
ncbi:MAG: IS1595 family transposase, partial [Syntrophorhabdales bacterium]